MTVAGVIEKAAKAVGAVHGSISTALAKRSISKRVILEWATALEQVAKLLRETVK